MTKKGVVVVCTLITGLIFFVGCSSANKTTSNVINVESDQLITEKKVLGIGDFEKLLSTQHVFVESTEYVVQREDSKALFPDILSASIKNNSNSDIKNIVAAFVAWDENNLPVKIRVQNDFTDGDYIKKFNYSDVNLPPSASSGKNGGLALNSESKIKTFKVIAKSYETFDGVTWENPYYDDFVRMYEGKKFSNDMTVEVTIDTLKIEIQTTEKSKDKKNTISEEEFNSQVSRQPVVISKTEHIVRDNKSKLLYPDILTVAIQNNSDKDIKDVVVSFVAWDENNLPVKIEEQFDFDGDYVKNINFSDVNLIPNAVYDEKSGIALSANSKVKKFKAIVKSYVTFDGTIWNNPLYEKFRELYVSKKLV